LQEAPVRKRLGILGGTFDPIHVGHLIMAEAVRQRYDLSKVLFIPSARPPHKEVREVTDPAHRFQLVSLAVADNPFFEVSDIEMNREGKCYTVDTLQAIQANEDQLTDCFFIIGGDSVPELRTWRNIEELAKLCTLVVVPRPGWETERLAREDLGLPEWIRETLIGNVVSAPLIGLSSTDIRETIERNKSIRYLVPRAVEEYIVAHGLYRKAQT
jgi:nicotinate-nucleotide adenylyltransferase